MSTPGPQGPGRDVRDHHVDRRQVDAWQHVEPSRTNPPRGLTSVPPAPLFVDTRSTPRDQHIHPRLQQAGIRCGSHRCARSLAPSARSHSRPGPLSVVAKAPGHARHGRTPQLVGGFSVGDTLVPIPNTTVKPHSADGTAGETRWESTSPPTFPFFNDPLRPRLRGSLSFGARRCSSGGASLWGRVVVLGEGSLALGGVVFGGRPQVRLYRGRRLRSSFRVVSPGSGEAMIAPSTATPAAPVPASSRARSGVIPPMPTTGI
jgi:hypothetical protein